MSIQISAIICAHNPDEKRLGRVFEALARQSLPKEEWECLLVDNASSPELAPRVDMSWHPAGRMIQESRLGLTPARLAGIEAARGELLLFVDDDCLLAPDYLGELLELMSPHPFLGVLGGYGTAEYETPPPPWMNHVFRWYHLDFPVPRDKHPLIYARTPALGGWVPVGAGMAVRRSVALGYAEYVQNDAVAMAMDRAGNQLAGGGDMDINIFATNQGYAVGRSSHLAFTHVVPSFRLELDYMVRLLYMSQFSVARLLIHRGWKDIQPSSPKTIWKTFTQKANAWKRLTPEARCWRAYSKGYSDALHGEAPDPLYCRQGVASR